MIRIGAVSYLNTKPLIASLRDRLADRGQLTLNLPSRLADDLNEGRLDVALIPIIESFRTPGLRVISDAGIACRGPVWSVRLLSRVPIDQIRTLALDEGSRTSAAMVQVLLWERYGLRPQTVPLGMEQLPESVAADAILIIGDRAMHPEQGVYEQILDLGDQWCRWTELPFVFAAWVARPGVDVSGLAEILQASRDDGLKAVQSIARREAARHGLTTEDLIDYFRVNLHYRLEAGELRAMELFRQKAAAIGLVRPADDDPGRPQGAAERFVE
ncbi:menaquinone biosynthetic enzyme MqnA/MqnD family protein [Crateriforma conspicua]|uniref:menaquinone biosynthetic enzyme MqnA/MqnD family protein n=1 Tax=Crateriforma conspicua TaxID=2527996 RepID=UPI001189710E|nr:menaquinone biosynthesis protein [Crateriforma conspicua]QDV64805.1 Chorismate dehydratase [Crateriforma conspicua]